MEIYAGIREYGETEEHVINIIFDDEVLSLKREWYTGITPSLFVGSYLRLEPIGKNLHGVGYQSIEEVREACDSQGLSKTDNRDLSKHWLTRLSTIIKTLKKNEV